MPYGWKRKPAVAVVIPGPTTNTDYTRSLSLTVAPNPVIARHSGFSRARSVTVAPSPTVVRLPGVSKSLVAAPGAPLITHTESTLDSIGSAGTVTQSYTVSSSANHILIIAFAEPSTTSFITGVDWDSVPLTLSYQGSNASGFTLSVWALTAPHVTSGALLNIHCSGATLFAQIFVEADAVHQTVPFGTPAADIGSGNTPSTNVGDARRALVLDFLVGESSALATPSNKGVGQNYVATTAPFGQFGANIPAGRNSIATGWTIVGSGVHVQAALPILSASLPRPTLSRLATLHRALSATIAPHPTVARRGVFARLLTLLHADLNQFSLGGGGGSFSSGVQPLINGGIELNDGLNRIYVLYVEEHNTDDTTHVTAVNLIDSVNAPAGTFTKLTTVASPTGHWQISIWYLLAPPVGSDYGVNGTLSTATTVLVSDRQYAGVDQANPWGGWHDYSGSGDSLTITWPSIPAGALITNDGVFSSAGVQFFNHGPNLGEDEAFENNGQGVGSIADSMLLIRPASSNAWNISPPGSTYALFSGWLRPAPIALSQTLSRSLAFTRHLSVTLTPHPTLTKALAFTRHLIVTRAVSPTLARFKAAARSLSVTVAPHPTLVKSLSFSRHLSVTRAVSPLVANVQQLARRLSLTRAPSQTLIGKIVIDKRLSVTVAPHPTLNRVLAASRHLSITRAVSPTVVRLKVAAKALSVTVAPSPVLARLRAASRSVVVAVTPHPTLIRAQAVARHLSATIAPHPTLARLKAAARALSVTVAPVVSLARQHANMRKLQVSVAPNPTLRRAGAFARFISVTRSVLPALAKARSVPKALAVTVAPHPTVTSLSSMARSLVVTRPVSVVLRRAGAFARHLAAAPGPLSVILRKARIPLLKQPLYADPVAPSITFTDSMRPTTTSTAAVSSGITSTDAVQPTTTSTEAVASSITSTEPTP